MASLSLPSFAWLASKIPMTQTKQKRPPGNIMTQAKKWQRIQHRPENNNRWWRKEIVLADRNFLLRRSMSKYWGGSCCKSKALARVSKEVGPSRSRSSGTRPFRAHLTLTADKTSEQNLFSELYISCRQGLIVWLQHILWTMLKLTLMQMQMQANRRHQPKLFQDYMHHKTGAKWGW